MEKCKKYQKEYELYMKKVTDSFIDMQSNKIYGTIGHDADRVFYEVFWDGGLEYKIYLNGNSYIRGITLEEHKKYNAKIANDYLKANTLTYENFIKKYHNEQIK